MDGLVALTVRLMRLVSEQTLGHKQEKKRNGWKTEGGRIDL